MSDSTKSNKIYEFVRKIGQSDVKILGSFDKKIIKP